MDEIFTAIKRESNLCQPSINDDKRNDKVTCKKIDN